MDRQDAKPRRPSLLAGAPEHAAATPSSARILADMEGHKPAARDVAQMPRGRWLWLPVAGVLMVAAGWFWQADFSRDDTGMSAAITREAPAQPSLGSASDASMVTPDALLAATIIDDSNDSADPTGNRSETADRKAEGGAGDDGANQAGPSTADPSPFAAIAAAIDSRRGTDAGPGNPFTAPPPSRATASGNHPPSASRAPRPVGEQTDLLATLLRNIQASAEPQPSGLDSLIEKMDAAEKIGTPPSAAQAQGLSSRSQQIQANLRECPAANSAKGLKCRQEICAVYAGRDPACPAM